ncbi:MAG TPA: MiaB/RimO family radical SAM methylthiotransferase [Methylomirabilota bacterium]|nr:MiaB/RimO family radical SAM methylthiotransferase [Methylomirabilota bacterium]
MSTVAFATLGCRLNQVDSQDLAARLEQRGFHSVPFEHGGPSRADVVIVNTCTVTGRADVSDRQMIRRAVRRHPGARVVVTGCWAQTDPDAVASLPGVDVVVGNADKPRLPEIVARLLEEASPRASARVEVSDIADVRKMPAPAPAAKAMGRSRAFLKVQEGCQHRCAFCIVPLARGVSRSLDPNVVIDHARQLVELGHPEIVLTGVDLGHYGADLASGTSSGHGGPTTHRRACGATDPQAPSRTSLAALVRALVEVPGLRWLRLSSVLPAYFTPELLDVVTTSPVIAPHLHIPLQSGSDRVLRRMRRPYNVAMYRGLVERLAAAIPGLGLGADVIVGFPGETDDDFVATMTLAEALPFSYLHVFGYSDRKDTAAAGLRDHVPAATIAKRSLALRELAEAKNLAFRQRMRGVLEDVLVLEARDRATGDLVGLTGNYVEVTFQGPDALMRTITRVRVTSVDGSATRGVASER